MDKSGLLSDEDESSSEIESEVNGSTSGFSQEIDTNMISACDYNLLGDSLDSESDDIYESLLKSSESLESPEPLETDENDPISVLEAFLKAHDEGNDTKVNESLIKTEKLEASVKENSNEPSAGIPMEANVCSKMEVPKRVLRPRSKMYWNESSLLYMKTQENMYSYYSALRKKRL